MKITLIGSTRFAAKFATYMERLSLAGHTVYGLAFAPRADGGPTRDEKTMLDLVHMKKILDSDAIVLVTDAEFYFGESTQRELAWAALLNRQIYVDVESVPSESTLITPTELASRVRDTKAQAEAHAQAIAALMTGSVRTIDPSKVN